VLQRHFFIIIYILFLFTGTGQALGVRGGKLNCLNGIGELKYTEINCIYQDSKGFMWFGTNNGLYRYDGYDVKVYKSNYLHPTLFASNIVLSITEDNTNTLWVGTAKGLHAINLKSDDINQIDSCYLTDHEILSMAITNNNVLYVGTQRGLFVYNRDENVFSAWNTDRSGEKISGNYIKSLFIDSKNYMWIGTWYTGYSVLNLNTQLLIEYPYLKDKENLIINSFFEDNNQNIWMTTWDKHGAVRIENPHQPSNSKLTYFYPPKSKTKLYYPVIYNIEQDPINNNICFATADGLYVLKNIYHAEQTVFLDHDNTTLISSAEIFTLFKDRTGLIWYSLYGLGVNTFTNTKNLFQDYDLVKLLNKNDITSSVTGIYEGDNNVLWIGVKSLGFVMYDRKSNEIIHYKDNAVLKDIPIEMNSALCFLKPKYKNELWIGTRYDGLYKISLRGKVIIKLEHFNLADLASNSNIGVNRMIEDASGSIWIATNKGLTRANWKEETEAYEFNLDKEVKDYFLNKNINTLFIDDQKQLWLGTDGHGIYKINYNGESNISTYNFNNKKINTDEVICMMQDSKLRIWAGTRGGGLNLYNRKSDLFQVIDNMNFIPDDAVYSMQEDNWGNLWLTTKNELISIGSDSSVGHSMHIFSENEGMNIYSFNQNAVFKNINNELFFGGNNGLMSFIPYQFEDNVLPPTPVITDFVLNNKRYNQLDPNLRNKIAPHNPSYANHLRMPYKENNITIHFSALIYRNVGALKYAYQLKGFDKDWIYTEAKTHSANYNNLPSGSYTFMVKSCNEVGNWSATPATIYLYVEPAPWNTVYAYIIYFIIIILTVYGIIRYTTNKLKYKRKILIEKIEREKEEEAHQAKLRFFTQISHEFFTPLTVMGCTIDGLKDEYPEKADSFEVMQANMNRLMRLLEQVVEFRRVETGNLKLKLSRINIVPFLESLVNIHFAPLVTEKNINLEFHAEEKVIDSYIDVDKLDKIVFNLLSNAFKYNKYNGSVIINVGIFSREEIPFLLITVTDSGYGMDEETKANIFKLFYEGNSKKLNVRSSGIGLSLVYDLVKFMGGEISVDSIEGMGSTFKVTLPIHNKDFTNGTDMLDTDTGEGSMYDSNYLLSTGGTENHAPINLLIVEDNVELVNAMTKIMDREYNIKTARNGKEALDILYNRKIDIVVTDILMPEMDGVELTLEMKSEVELSHIPIIMLSAKHNIEQKLEGFEAGADVYLTKPFEIQVLIANINSIIKNRRILIESLKSDFTLEKVSQFGYNKLDKDFIQKVTNFISENVLKKNLTTQDLYEEFHMSQPTMYRKLQAIVGMSPHELIQKVKIQVACSLLLEKNLNISEISFDLGFNDPKYFSSLFKKLIGITPSEYIQQNNKN